MKLQLKGKALLEKSGSDNIHQFAMKSQVSAATVYKHIAKPESVKNFDTEILVSFLMNGLGLSKKQILELKIGELFEIVESE